MRKHGSSEQSSPTRNCSAKKTRGSRDECLQLSTVNAESMLEAHSCVSSEIPNHKRPRPCPPNETSELINSIGRDLSIKCLLHCSRSDYGSIACLNQSFRSLIRSDDLYKLRKKMGITEPWIYFTCNVLEWVAYDPYRSRWINFPRIPSYRFSMCSDKESLVVGTDILVFGRKDIIIRYNILTNSWSLGKEMNFPRSLFGSASFGEKAIIAGGTDTFGNVLNSAELYNSELQAWETLPSMNNPRKMCSGVFMDGKFYIIGGMGNNKDLMTCGEEYDPIIREWRVIPNMSSVLNGHIGAPPRLAVVNNELYSADYGSNELIKYDKEYNQWFILGQLPDRHTFRKSWYLAFRACGERLIVISGYDLVYGRIIELYSWIPNEGKPEWNMIVKKCSTSLFVNCAVMSC